MKKTGPAKKIVALIEHRSNGQCERCGRGRFEQVHHRKPRGAGGTSDPAINLPSNLLALCSPCHVAVERDRSVAYERGWLVRREHDPAVRPVWIANRGFMFLKDDGTFKQEAAA